MFISRAAAPLLTDNAGNGYGITATRLLGQTTSKQREKAIAPNSVNQRSGPKKHLRGLR